VNARKYLDFYRLRLQKIEDKRAEHVRALSELNREEDDIIQAIIRETS